MSRRQPEKREVTEVEIQRAMTKPNLYSQSYDSSAPSFAPQATYRLLNPIADVFLSVCSGTYTEDTAEKSIWTFEMYHTVSVCL